MELPVPSTDLISQCAKMMTKEQFESAFGRLMMKMHLHDFGHWEYDYVTAADYLSLSLKNFFEPITVEEEADQRMSFTMKINEVAKYIIDQHYNVNEGDIELMDDDMVPDEGLRQQVLPQAGRVGVVAQDRARRGQALAAERARRRQAIDEVRRNYRLDLLNLRRNIQEQ